MSASRRHAWLDHTSEVQLQVAAESLAGLAAEAGRALGILLLRGTAPRPGTDRDDPHPCVWRT